MFLRLWPKTVPCHFSHYWCLCGVFWATLLPRSNTWNEKMAKRDYFFKGMYQPGGNNICYKFL